MVSLHLLEWPDCDFGHAVEIRFDMVVVVRRSPSRLRWGRQISFWALLITEISRLVCQDAIAFETIPGLCHSLSDLLSLGPLQDFDCHRRQAVLLALKFSFQLMSGRGSILLV